jgi:hypothetical protein
VAGSGFSSRGYGAQAPLILIVFAHADEPDVPLLEVLAVGRDVGSLEPEELADLLSRARPFVRVPARQALFTETRVGKKGEG